MRDASFGSFATGERDRNFTVERFGVDTIFMAGARVFNMDCTRKYRIKVQIVSNPQVFPWTKAGREFSCGWS